MKPHQLLLIFFLTILSAVPVSAQIEWHKDIEEATALAIKSGKPMLLDFTAKWCEPCPKLEETFWVRPEIIKAAGQFVCVKINRDSNKDLAEKYEVHSLPYTIFTDPWGRQLIATLGLKDAVEDMLKKMELFPPDFSGLREASDALERNKDDLTALNKFAVFYEQREFYFQSNEFNSRILKIETDPQKREGVMMKMGENYLKGDLSDKALFVFESFQKEFPASAQMEKVFFEQIVAYERKDKIKIAQKILVQLRTKFPNSIFIAAGEKLIYQHIQKSKIAPGLYKNNII